MFDTAYVMVDENLLPILIIPEEMPQGLTRLDIVEEGIDIRVDDTLYGRIRGMDETTLAMLGLQETVGMATGRAEPGQGLPEEIQYVAQVSDTRA